MRRRKSEIIRSVTLAAQGVGSGTGAIHDISEWDAVIVHARVTVGGTLALVPHGSADGTNFGPYRDELGNALTAGAAIATGTQFSISFSRSVLGRYFRLAWTVAAAAVTATVDVEFVKTGGNAG